MQLLKTFLTKLGEIEKLLRLESYHLKHSCRHRWRQEPDARTTMEG